MIKKIGRFLSTQKLSSRYLSYPFQYTFAPEKFDFTDYRFEQYSARQQLFEGEKQHIVYVLDLFQKLINKNVSDKATQQYIDKKLVERVQSFKKLLKSEQIQTQFVINGQQCKQTEGYLEYYGVLPNRFIHEYVVTREDDKVILLLNEQLEKLAKKEGVDQLKKDFQDFQKQNSIGHQIKEKMFKQKKSSQIFFKLFDLVESALKPTSNKSFVAYYLTNKIKTKMNIIGFQKNKSSEGEKIENVEVVTKWYYEVTSDQPQSIRKSRKRVLYDFQLWNRGSFLSVQNFAQ